MRLILIRHAKSSWKGDVPDHERALNARGREDAPKIARWMKTVEIRPELVLCSDAARAVETWDLMQPIFEEAGCSAPVEYHSSIYKAAHGGNLSDLTETIGAVDDAIQTLVVVGHNPSIEDLVLALTGESKRVTTCNVLDLRHAANSWFEFVGRGDVEIWSHLFPREPRS